MSSVPPKEFWIASSPSIAACCVLFAGLAYSCEQDAKSYRAHEVARCKSRHLLGETNMYDEHLGCLRETKAGYWERVRE